MWSLGLRARSPLSPHPVFPAVGILPEEQEEPELILEEADPHWEEDERQDGSTSPQGSEAVASAYEESEAMGGMPRWEPDKALNRRLGRQQAHGTELGRRKRA